ncbi:MAG: hypothetical protein AAGG06_05300 [Pseudomonadota bacterium]
MAQRLVEAGEARQAATDQAAHLSQCWRDLAAVLYPEGREQQMLMLMIAGEPGSLSVEAVAECQCRNGHGAELEKRASSLGLGVVARDAMEGVVRIRLALGEPFH